MVLATRAVNHWTRGDGGAGTSAAEFISVPGDLDVAALDSRYGIGLADAARGAGA